MPLRRRHPCHPWGTDSVSLFLTGISADRGAPGAVACGVSSSAGLGLLPYVAGVPGVEEEDPSLQLRAHTCAGTQPHKSISKMESDPIKTESTCESIM